jgi:hypothetical protein
MNSRLFIQSLVDAAQQSERERQAKQFGTLEVDDQFDPGSLLDR